MTALPTLAAFDLDGTLLNSAKEITPRTLDAVRALAATGCVCCLASGRMYRDCMDGYAAQLGLPSPVIAYNGAMILGPDGEIWDETSIPAELCQPVLDEVIAHDRHLNIYHRDTMYCRRPTAWGDLYIERTGARPVYRDDVYEWFAGKTSTKLLIVDAPETISRLREEFSERYGGALYITITEREYLEFIHPDSNKGRALLALCAHFGLDPADSVGFGDAPNDIPLLELAGRGYAMADARSSVKAVADALAPSNDEDGVAQVIEGWLAAR